MQDQSAFEPKPDAISSHISLADQALGTHQARRRRFMSAFALISGFIFVTANALPATVENGILVRICSGGNVRYVTLEGIDAPAPTDNNHQTACHGPCINARKGNFFKIKL